MRRNLRKKQKTKNFADQSISQTFLSFKKSYLFQSYLFISANAIQCSAQRVNAISRNAVLCCTIRFIFNYCLHIIALKEKRINHYNIAQVLLNEFSLYLTQKLKKLKFGLVGNILM